MIQRLIRIHLLALATLLIASTASRAQEGQFISLFAGPQLVALDNADDYTQYGSSDIINRETTMRWSGGLMYHYNFAPYYGFQTGLYYSQQGQKYSGRTTRDLNTKDTGLFEFQSHLHVNYLRIPVMIRFNSAMDPQDRVNLSLMVGFYYGIMTGIQDLYTSMPAPDSSYNNYPDLNINDLFRSSEFGLTAHAQVNVRLTDRLGTFIGVRFDRSLTNAENHSARFNNGLAPAEYYFPLSTKKAIKPDILTRSPSKNNTIGLQIGLSYRFAGSGNVVPKIQPADAGQDEEF